MSEELARFWVREQCGEEGVCKPGFPPEAPSNDGHSDPWCQGLLPGPVLLRPSREADGKAGQDLGSGSRAT